MTHGLKTKPRDQSVDFASQQWNVAWRGEIGARGPKTDDAMLAQDLALGTEMFDCNVIQMSGSMNPRLLGCLGHDHGSLVA